MGFNRRSRPLWLRCIVAVFLVILAAAIRWKFLGVLELRAAFVTFFPAVAIASLYGGFTAGLLATVVAAALAEYFWFLPISLSSIAGRADQISMVVFLASAILISFMAEAIHRARARANRAEEQARLLAERERAEEKLREQRERFKVTLASIGDGVLSSDTEGKVTFINPVAAALTGWTIEQSVGQPVQSIFRIINEKTRAPADDIVARVFREGHVVGLANHTALVARDGKEIPIEDSAAPIKDSNGNVSGVVLVFHDVTEKRQAQAALEESEKYYRFLFDNMLNGFAYCRMIFEEGVPVDFIYLKVNGAFETLTGLRNVCGKKVSEVVPGIRESDPELLEIYGKVSKTGVPERFETFVEALGQWFSISVYSPLAEHFVAVFDVITERKRAEQNTARLAAIVESSDDAIIAKTLDGEILSWNRSAQAMYEYTPEEAIGRSISILAPVDVHNEFPSILEKIRRAEVVEHFETRRRKKSGGVIDVSLSVSPIRDASGHIVGVSTIARDITERRRMELEKEVTTELLQLINDSTGTSSLIKAAATFFQRQSGCEAVGIRLKDGDDFPYSEARGFPEEFVHMENSLCAKDAFGKDLRDSTGNPLIECMCGNVILGRVDPTKPFFSKGGSFWTNSTTRLLATTSEADRRARTRNRCNGEGYESVALIPLRVGKERLGLIQLNDRRQNMFSPEIIFLWERLAGYLAVALSRSRTTEALREGEERFRVMADSIPQLAWLAKSDGYIYWYNQRWMEYTGTTPEQMEGWGWQRVHDPEVLPSVLERWKESIATGKSFDMVFPLRGADGKFRSFLTRVEPVKDIDGKVIQWCGTNTDITEREEMENELRKSRSELELRVEERTAEIRKFMTKLEQSNQALQDFASIASHDLQEPLRKVVSFGDMLSRKYGDSLGQTGNDYLSRMLDATVRMQSLLKGLLEYSRVTTKADPFVRVDLKEIVAEVLCDLEVRIQTTGGKVDVGDLPAIQADPTQMRQLFQNLIGNALKFRREDELPGVYVKSGFANGKLHILVEDNGIGFEEEYVDRIFAPFQRLHGRSSRYEGTGMGLAICKKIVERHGGSITAKSIPGGGAKFIIELPLT